MPNFDFRSGAISNYLNYPIYIVSALGGIIISNNIAKWITHFKLLAPLQYIGYNSMVYFVTHWILIDIVVLICRPNEIKPLIIFSTALLSILIVTPTIVRFSKIKRFSFMFGK